MITPKPYIKMVSYSVISSRLPFPLYSPNTATKCMGGLGLYLAPFLYRKYILVWLTSKYIYSYEILV